MLVGYEHVAMNPTHLGSAAATIRNTYMFSSHVIIDGHLHPLEQAPPSPDYMPGTEHPPSPDYVPGDDEEEESFEDDEEEAFEEDEDEEEELLAPANSAVATSPPLPRSPQTKIPSPTLPVLSPPLLLPSPPTHTSPTYAEAPLGYRAAMIKSRTASPPPVPSPPLLLPSAALRDDIPEPRFRRGYISLLSLLEYILMCTAALATYFLLIRCLKANKHVEVYYEYMEPFKSLILFPKVGSTTLNDMVIVTLSRLKWNSFALTVGKCTSSGIFITSSGNDLNAP
nr:hypothetical protein [Tanacetum cinerariifolium]